MVVYSSRKQVLRAHLQTGNCSFQIAISTTFVGVLVSFLHLHNFFSELDSKPQSTHENKQHYQQFTLRPLNVFNSVVQNYVVPEMKVRTKLLIQNNIQHCNSAFLRSAVSGSAFK